MWFLIAGLLGVAQMYVSSHREAPWTLHPDSNSSAWVLNGSTGEAKYCRLYADQPVNKRIACEQASYLPKDYEGPKQFPF